MKDKIDLINDDVCYIIENTHKSNITSKYLFDDNYILPSLKTLLKKIDNKENIIIYLISKNSGTITQRKKGNYKYIQIKFSGYKYEEVDEYLFENDILSFLTNDKLCFFEIGAFLDLFNLIKTYNKDTTYSLINSILKCEEKSYFTKLDKKYIDDIYNKINEDYINNKTEEPLIKKREMERLKKILQEYYDISKSSILPSYRLQKNKDDKNYRYYTLESLVVLDEILTIYKRIKEDKFYFIRNISYLDDTNDIKEELFNKDKVLINLKEQQLIKNHLYIKDTLEIFEGNDKKLKERADRVKKEKLDVFFDIDTASKMDRDELKEYIEDYIFILFNNINKMLEEYKYNENNINLIEKIINYDLHFFYFKFILDYLFLSDDFFQNGNIEYYNNLHDLYSYKYFYLKKNNIILFENIYIKCIENNIYYYNNKRYPYRCYLTNETESLFKKDIDTEMKFKLESIFKNNVINIVDDFEYLYSYYDFLVFHLYYKIIIYNGSMSRIKKGAIKAIYEELIKLPDNMIMPDTLLSELRENFEKILLITDIIYFSNIKNDNIKKLRSNILELDKKIDYINNIINDYEIDDIVDYLEKDEYANENNIIDKIPSYDVDMFEHRKYYEENISDIMKIYSSYSEDSRRPENIFALFFNYSLYLSDDNNLIYKNIEKILNDIKKVNELYHSHYTREYCTFDIDYLRELYYSNSNWQYYDDPSIRLKYEIRDFIS
ncbi:hypothetical protein OFR20_09125 [Brachyspira hyodysenteriae]|uniref:hypothetical protein n=1 Tax=Brachyspira hyodysenteriae TaxID=159 RepID=UPI0022CD86AF|nr:hypothetical protein [Brachyspira hyodysenteriae]MCZ9981678.1 hypothetical protein [Brachyspira hyodysenteriae]